MSSLSVLNNHDLATEMVCSYKTQFLPRLGAGATNVASDKGGLIRDIGFFQTVGMRSLYLNANRSKQSIAVNLKAGCGMQVVLGFYNDTGTLIYYILEAAIGRVSLSYKNVCQVNTSIVCAGCFACEQDDPYGVFLAYHTLFQGIVLIDGQMLGRPHERTAYNIMTSVPRNTWQSADRLKRGGSSFATVLKLWRSRNEQTSERRSEAVFMPLYSRQLG